MNSAIFRSERSAASANNLATGSRLWTLACIGALALPAAANARSVQDFSAADPYIEKVLADWQVPGAAVVVVKDGKLVFSKGYGVRELGRPERVDAHTLFGLGSVSKTFTTAIVARLVDQGRLGWDDKIIDHLPSFRLADPWVTANVTIRDVLAHRVGLDEEENNLPWIFDSIDRKEYVSRLRHMPLRGRFRDTPSYSNGLLSMMGELLEAVTGKRWEDLVAAEVFTSLGMTRSVSGRDELVSPSNLVPDWLGRAPQGAVKGQAGLRAGIANVAAPHGLDRNGKQIVYHWHHEQANAPAGGVTSSAHDMGLYMLAHFASADFLEPETLQAMFSLQLSRRHEQTDDGSPRRVLGSGLGWGVYDYRGHRAAGHGGGQVGYTSRTVLIPSKGLGVTVLSNDYFWDERLKGWRPVEEIIALRLLDHALGLAPVDLNTRFRQQVLQSERETEQSITRHFEDLAQRRTPPALPLAQYAGRYTHPANGGIDITLDRQRLVFRFAPLITGDLVHETGETFRLRFDSESAARRLDAIVTFSSRLKARPGSISLQMLANLTDEPYPVDWTYLRDDPKNAD